MTGLAWLVGLPVLVRLALLMGLLVLVGSIEPWVAVMPLAGAGVLVTALAHDTRVLRQRLDWGLDQLPGRSASPAAGVEAGATAVLSGTGGGIA